MKRENLMLVAGALLASTSITTAANAGTIGLRSGGLAYTTAGNQNFSATALILSAQAFSSATAGTVSTGTVDLVLRFASQLPVTFNGVITATNAQFAGSASTAQGLAFEGTGATIYGSVNMLTNNTAVCTSVLATGDKIFLQNCNGAQALSVGGAAVITAAGVIVTGVSFKLLSGLATAGTSISLGAEIYLGTTQATSIDSTTAAAKVTSRNGITVQGGASTASTIDVAASKGAFTGLITSNLSAQLGSVQFSTNATLSLDLSTSIAAGANLAANGTEVRLTSAIFTDDATNQVRVSGSTAGNFSTNLSAGYVTLTVAAASLSGYLTEIFVDFNGTGQIDNASAGSTAVTFVTAGGNGATGNASAVPSQTLSGSIAAISRNGLTVDLNGIYAGDYPVQYTSVVRIANTGAVAGTPTVQIYDESTGSLLGTATPTTSIPGGGSKQYTAKDLETLAGISATGFKTYRMTVTAGISGYVQQLLWNQTGGFFTDLSSRRTTKAGGL